MKIAFIIPKLVHLGPVKVIQSLVNNLCEYEDLTIFYLDKDIDRKIKLNIPAIKYNSSSIAFHKYDIIHTSGIRPDLIAFLNRKKIKYHISTIHNFVFDDLSFTYNRLFSLFFGNLWLILWKRADRLVCVSNSLKEHYSKWFASPKLEVIYNGISAPDESIVADDNIIQIIKKFKSDGFRVLGCAGILTRRKGIDSALQLIANKPDFALIIIGDGKESPVLKNMARKLKITERCFFTGFREGASIYFKYFDLFLMPSRSEGFGLTLIEAVQQKVPVVCSDLEVFNELMNNNEVTFFKSDDMSSLERAVNEVFENSEKKIEFAYNRYMENYTDKLMAKGYSNLYHSAVK